VRPDGDIVVALMRLGRENPDGDPHRLATDVLNQTRKNDLLPLLVREIEHGQRSAVRDERDEAFAALWERRESAAGSSRVVDNRDAETLEAFRSMFHREIAIGDGQRVKVSDATKEQWEQRRAMLAANVRGLEREIAVCDEAIRLLREHDRDRLADLNDA
jgi:hypothetical protein